MTFDHHVLLWLLTLPLLAAIVVAMLGPNRGPLIRAISLGASIMVFVLAAVLAGRFMSLNRPLVLPQSGRLPTFTPEFVPGSTALEPHVTTWDLFSVGSGSVQFYLGVDGLNLWLIVLTAALMLPSVLISWTHITQRVNEFYAWLLALQTCMFGIFMAFDIILFYVFFEVSLVPLFFLIGVWGGPQRQHAARKFFIFTLTGSMLTLLGLLGVVLACFDHSKVMTFSIPRLVDLVHSGISSTDPLVRSSWASVQFWVFMAMMAGFAVKVPLVPFHTWLPLAHVEAPTAGSVDLAGVLLKVGAYGFLRLCIPLAPDTSLAFGLPIVTVLATIGIVYGAFCAYSQDDMKRLIAYSSVSHLGVCMLGMFSLNPAGLSGSLMQMINHGLSTALLFLLIGMIYERYHTRRIEDYGGMASKMPLFAVFLVFTCLSSAGLPGLNGFIGEALCLIGIFQHEMATTHRPFLAVLAATSMVLGAWYLFTMLRRLLFGALKEPAHEGHSIADLNAREWLLLTPPVIMCIILGLYPKPVLESAAPDVELVSYIADRARVRSGLAPIMPAVVTTAQADEVRQ